MKNQIYRGFYCRVGKDTKHETLIIATTAGEARYMYWLHIHDCCPDIMIMDVYVRVAECKSKLKQTFIDQDRLDKANQVLSTMKLMKVRLVDLDGHIGVIWKHYEREEFVIKPWITQNDSDYPIWQYGDAGMGGTCCQALSQLIRWVLHKPCFGMSVWEYCFGQSLRLCDQETISKLREVGYQEKNICILCHKETKGLDWWQIGSGSGGPCCSFGLCEEDCKAARDQARSEAMECGV